MRLKINVCKGNCLPSQFKTSPIAKAVCLSLFMLSSAVLAQTPILTFDKTFDYILSGESSNYNNSLINFNKQAGFSVYSKESGKWESIVIGDNPDGSGRIAEFDINYSFNISKDGYFPSISYLWGGIAT